MQRVGEGVLGNAGRDAGAVEGAVVLPSFQGQSSRSAAPPSSTTNAICSRGALSPSSARPAVAGTETVTIAFFVRRVMVGGSFSRGNDIGYGTKTIR
ncbi:hypothetical protein [Streptomyces sp. TRM70350]|uniref:hypothetical protein n=1 Tax=Streptomyces sp. TRM70350 TaxID=2856165 RepID=UPI001C463866|nr:hypothetical protein [Streptomyces sp. TRM70350]MBV7695450.1 hypothetical protein [Streptomyces sp. TRM70350]